MKTIPKPQPGEFPPFASKYIDLVPDDGLLLQYLMDNLAAVHEVVKALPQEKFTTPCADGEWTVQEILVHVMDSERILAYRALRFARGDATALPGFEQDDYVPASYANIRSMESILEEYDTVRDASLTLFKSLPEETFIRAGMASGYRLTVRGAMYFVAGHERHHLNSIRENYLGV